MSISRNNFIYFILIFILPSCVASKNKDHLDKVSYYKLIKEINSEDSFELAIKEIYKKHYQNEQISISRLNGGMSTTKIFLIEIEGQKFLLRTLNPKYDLPRRNDEIKIHNFAAHIGITPKLLYIDKKKRFIIMEYLEGSTLNEINQPSSKIINEIALILAKLHNYRGDFKQNRPQIWRTKKHYDRAHDKNIAFPSGYDETYEKYYQEGRQINSNKDELVLCHGDLNPSNIILTKNGSIFLLDWSSATWDNKYSDLGYFSFLNGLSADQSKMFLSSYLGRIPKKSELDKLKRAQKRTSFLTSAVWFDFSEENYEKLIPIKIRQNNLDKLLANPKLKTAQEYINKREVVSLKSAPRKDIKLYALGFLKYYNSLSQN